MRAFKLFFTIALFLVGCSLQPLKAAENQFSFEADNSLLIDKKTALMWPVQDNGYDVSWQAAKRFCLNFNLAGYSDWRMPSQQELASLYRLQGVEFSDYYIVKEIRISACCLWAQDTRGPKVASFDFAYGNKDWGHPRSTVEARVLPVRNVE